MTEQKQIFEAEARRIANLALRKADSMHVEQQIVKALQSAFEDGRLAAEAPSADPSLMEEARSRPDTSVSDLHRSWYKDGKIK